MALITLWDSLMYSHTVGRSVTPLLHAPRRAAQVREGLHYNPYFPGGAIAMPKMLADGGTEYDDETPATESQQAKVPGPKCPACTIDAAPPAHPASVRPLTRVEGILGHHGRFLPQGQRSWGRG